jgi:hypothetical protein
MLPFIDRPRRPKRRSHWNTVSSQQVADCLSAFLKAKLFRRTRTRLRPLQST